MQKEIEPVKDESAQRYKDLQEEFKLYQAVKKNPRKASEQVCRVLVRPFSDRRSFKARVNLDGGENLLILCYVDLGRYDRWERYSARP